jgi:hypothetical protein
MITRRHVEAPIRPSHESAQALGIRKFAADALKLGAPQPALIAARTQQRFDPVPARDQLVHEIRSDKSGCAGDKAIHCGHEKLEIPNSTIQHPENNQASKHRKPAKRREPEFGNLEFVWNLEFLGIGGCISMFNHRRPNFSKTKNQFQPMPLLDLAQGLGKNAASSYAA